MKEEPATAGSVPEKAEAASPPAATTGESAAEFAVAAEQTLLVQTSEEDERLEWVRRFQRGDFDAQVDTMQCFASDTARCCAIFALPGAHTVAPDVLPAGPKSSTICGTIAYRFDGPAKAEPGTTVVRVQTIQVPSKAALEGIFVQLGAVRDARLAAAQGSPGAGGGMSAMEMWMASQAAAAGDKPKRNCLVSALCCAISPIKEFTAEVCSPIMEQVQARRPKTPDATAVPSAPTPSDGGLVSLQAAVAEAQVPGGAISVTIVVEAKDAAGLADFDALWATKLMLGLAISADAATTHQGTTVADKTELKRYLGYIGAVLALTHYATCAEKLFLFVAVAGMLFNAGGMSQMASVTARLIILVLQSDWDAAQDTSYELLYWGCAFAASQLTCFFVLERTAEVLSARFRTEYFKAMLRQDQTWYDMQPKSLSVDLTQDVNFVRDGIGRALGLYITMLFNFPIAMTRAIIRGPKLALILCIGVPFIWKAGKMTLDAYMKAMISSKTAYAVGAQYVEEILNSMATLTSIGGERRAQVTYSAKNDGVYATLRKSAWKDSKGLSFLFGVIYIMNGVGLFFGSRLIRDDEDYNAGVYVEVSMNVTWGSMMLGMVTVVGMPYRMAVNAARKMLGVIQLVPTIDPYAVDGAAPGPTEPGAIELRNVRFAYPKAPTIAVLKGISLKIPAGSITALVGGSGCGKSTVIRLIQRLYDPSEGAVLLDGVPLRSMNVKQFRSILGVVSQEPLLFDTTIEDNIRMGAAQDVTEEEIKEACHVADALSFITNDQELGLQTRVGRGGGKLSGGQKQRIAIARAMVRKPKILLLDEATSALDENSQELVQERVQAKMREGGGTIVMIAHRQTTFMKANCIACFVHGEVVEYAESSSVAGAGAHDQLMELKGEYYALFSGSSSNKDVGITGNSVEASMLSTESEQAVVAAHQVDVKLDEPVHLSQEDQVLRKQLSVQVAALPPPKSQILATAPKKRCCCNGPQRVVNMMGSLRWTIPCCIFFSALYGSAIPGLMITNSYVTAHLGKCLPTYDMANQTIVELGEEVLERCHDEMIVDTNVFVVAFLCFSVLATAISYMKNVSLQLTIAAVTRSLRDATFNSIVRQEFAYFEDSANSPFALSNRLADDCELVAKGYGNPIAAIADLSCSLAVAYVVAIPISWKLVLATLAVIPLIAFFTRKQRGLGETAQRRMQALVADAATVAGDASTDIGTVATFNIQLKVLDLYSSLIQERRSEGIIFAMGVAMTFMIAEFGRYFNQFICYVYGSNLASLGELTGAEVIRVEQSVMSATFSTTGAVGQIPDLAKAASAQGYILNTIDRASAIDTLVSSEAQGGMSTAKPSGSCEFVMKAVTFSYPSARDTLSLVAMDLTIRGGESTALVGGSGSGKSTVIRLLQRLYDPTFGCIEMDGVDLREMDPAWLRRQLAVVGQEPVLYNASIMDNVKYGGPLDPTTGEPTATDEQAIEACKRANAADFIEELPQKYNTAVQRSGGSLSGGQKQRIAIARALIREPSVFLLDEATSALDSQSEAVVKEALDRETAGKTVVMIAHRLTTTRICDNIILLDHGVVAEQCSRQDGVSAHEQLLADEFPKYSKLWRPYAAMNM